MNSEKRGVIIGMALGDGHIQVRQRLGQGKYPYESRTMRVLHGESQRLYVEWKAKRLGWALGGRQINVTKVKNGPGGRYSAYQFGVSHPYFGQVKRWLYPGGQKRLSGQVLDMLTPEGIAIWYMDDGHARRNTNKDGRVTSVATNIATMCSEEEVEQVIQWFIENHGIAFKKRCKKTCSPGSQFFIEANTEESKKFGRLIEEYIPEPMLYKLSHLSDMRSHECQTPVGECRECNSVIYEKRRGGLCTACYSREYYRNVRRHADGRKPHGSRAG
jgi:hypothetical protein|tara:strand:- start:84 stop:902 length:819 start_codon:yes stop_codon:yes gene_type:complete